MRHAPANTEVVVVDDASAGAAAGAAARRSVLRSVRLERQSGFAIAANTGIRACRGDIVEMLNDDTEVQAGWADAVLPWFADPAVGSVAPLVLAWPDGKVIDSAGDRYYLGGVAGKRGRGRDADAGKPARVPGIRRQRGGGLLSPVGPRTGRAIRGGIRQLLRGRRSRVPAAGLGLPRDVRAGVARAAPHLGIVWPRRSEIDRASVVQRGTRVLAEPAKLRAGTGIAEASRGAGGEGVATRRGGNAVAVAAGTHVRGVGLAVRFASDVGCCRTTATLRIGRSTRHGRGDVERWAPLSQEERETECSSTAGFQLVRDALPAVLDHFLGPAANQAGRHHLEQAAQVLDLRTPLDLRPLFVRR